MPPPSQGVSLALRDANFTLDLAAVGPADVRQGISQHRLRARIDTYTHFVEVWSILRGSPNASCNRLTGFPTLPAAMLGTERTA
jgi:hypothetical protein